MKVRVLVRLKQGVLDVQGKAIEHGLRDMGITALTDVKVGKMIELEVQGKSGAEAHKAVDEVCKSLLANTVIEQYEIQEIK